MQIDILSSNTLKLTLSRLDMFDLDIKYESLSGKNPETKRLLAHVLKKIRLDQLDKTDHRNQKLGFDFTCERIFVEAFPRPDGGCMLYVSSLEAEGGNGKKKQRVTRENETGYNPISFTETVTPKREPQKNAVIFETECLTSLGGVCRGLAKQREWNRLNVDTALYKGINNSKYRLIIRSENSKHPLIAGIIREYGEILRGERELYHTKEYFNEVIEEEAAERLSELL
ncbi:MAG: adaptor protein MecA [Oscillospiraceae bacterium]|nr:adaptor protein MecA [Oscillospiraceae bacterium]